MFGSVKKGLMNKLMPGMDELVALQEQLKREVIVGKAADGKVKVYLKGTMEVEDIKIDPEYFENTNPKALAKDLKKAFKDAYKQLTKRMLGMFKG